jgi:hypothetical protein
MNKPLLAEEDDHEEVGENQDIQIQAQSSQEEIAFLNNKLQEYEAKITTLKADLRFLKTKNTRQQQQHPQLGNTNEDEHLNHLKLSEMVLLAKNLQGKLQEAQEKGVI